MPDCRRAWPSGWPSASSSPRVPARAAALKILILKPSSLGDVVQALPVLRMLKRHFVDSEIHWWIEKNSAPLLEADPDLAGVIPFDRKRWGKPWNGLDVLRSVHSIRKHRFDIVIDLQALLRSGAVSWIANGGFAIGLQDFRELAPGFYDVSVPRPSPETHAVDWYLEVLKPLHVPVRWDFEWLPKNSRVALEVEHLWPLDGAPFIVLQPGARWLNKRWPVEHFGELMRLLHARRPDLRFVIVGGNDDRVLGEHLSGSAPGVCLDLTGRTTLPQAIELLRASRLMVTNDTGPMHIAAALGKPIVGLFGPTNPARTGPYGQTDHTLRRTELPCVPCMKSSCSYSEPLACLRRITPPQVAESVLARLGS